MRSEVMAESGQRRERMDWVDIIKATSVVLVVLLHVTQTLTFAAEGTAVSDFWNGAMTFLEPLRMPVFFVVSGILASSAVKRPWSHTRSRTIGILYLYLLWHSLLTILSVGVDLLTQGYVSGGIAAKFQASFLQIFLTPGGYWYFSALVLYFVLARLLRNVNPWLVLGVVASLNLARPLVTELVNSALEPIGVPHMMPSVILNAGYFFAGVYLVQFFKDYALRNDSQLLVASATVALLGSAARLLSPEVAAGSFLPIAIAWVLTAILIAVRLQDNEQVVAFGRYVGPRTLSIFVIQFVVLEGVYTTLGMTGGGWLAGNPLLALLYPLVLTLAIVALSLWIYDRALANSVTSLLFKAPAAWTAKPAAGTDAPADSWPAVPVMAELDWTNDTVPALPVERDHRATRELPVIA